MIPYAEVIGDPVAHSLSPLLHKHWLDRSGIEADYRATRVTAAQLSGFLDERRGDPLWRGCNVTAPLKEAAIASLYRIEPTASRIGAVNCIVRTGQELAGHNTDVEGIRVALCRLRLRGAKAVVIGAGGAARAACLFLSESGARVQLLARRHERAAEVASLASSSIEPLPFNEVRAAIGSADLIVNATPAGMTGNAAPPAVLIDSLSSAAPDAVMFDMVYRPETTTLIAAAAAAGLRTVGGLPMLVAQARRSFSLLFGALPPQDEDGTLAGKLGRALA